MEDKKVDMKKIKIGDVVILFCVIYLAILIITFPKEEQPIEVVCVREQEDNGSQLLLSNTYEITKDYATLFKNELDGLNKQDKKEWFIQYKKLIEKYSEYTDSPEETVYDYVTNEEFELFCGIVEAEIGNGTFEQKCNVASSIITRYFNTNPIADFGKTFMDILTQKNQYSTYSNGMYKKVEITEETILAIEYSFMIEDTAQGCQYFRSGSDPNGWHETSNNIEFIFDDGKHKFYRLKEKEEVEK